MAPCNTGAQRELKPQVADDYESICSRPHVEAACVEKNMYFHHDCIKKCLLRVSGTKKQEPSLSKKKGNWVLTKASPPPWESLCDPACSAR